MGSGQTLPVGDSQRSMIGQTKVQRLVGIEESPGGGPNTRQEPEQRDGHRRLVAVAPKPRFRDLAARGRFV